MKRLSWLFMIMIFIACNTKQPDKATPETDTIKTVTTDTVNSITDMHYFWNADWDQNKGLVMKKVSPLPGDSLTPAILIQKLNSLYPEIQLRYKKNISGHHICCH